MLIYGPSMRPTEIFHQCSRLYDAPFSEIVPILPPLQEWIDRLLCEHLQGKVWVGEEAHGQRKELAHIMMHEYS